MVCDSRRVDPKRIVEGGYDQIARTGGHAFEEVNEDWLGELSEVREEEDGHRTVSFHWAIARKPG